MKRKLVGLRFYFITIVGAMCWGLIGLFINPLYNYGFTPWDVVAIRGIFSFIILIIFMLIFHRDKLHTKLKDQLYFAGAGILGIAFFNYFYFETFSKSSLSLAVTLLYTGPFFVLLLSRFFLKESLTVNKMLSLIFAIIGCAFVVGLIPFQQANLSLHIILTGIASGFCYALYSIFSKPLTKRYDGVTITTYTFFYISIFMVFSSNLVQKTEKFQHPEVWLYVILLSLVGTVAGYIFYATGLKYLEASKASILTTIEPIVAILAGILFLKEQLNYWQILGIILIVFSVILITYKQNEKKIASTTLL